MAATTTDRRAAELLAQFEATNAGLMAAVEACPASRWPEPCAGDERSVGVVAHHVATVYPAFARMVDLFATGQTYTPNPSMGDVHQHNSRHAAENAAATKPAALVALRENGAAVAQALRRLSDADLDRAAGVFGGNALSVAQVVEYVVIGHTAEHLASIRATLGGNA